MCSWKLLSLVQLFVTPWTTQFMEFSRPEYWSGWPFPSPGDLPNSGTEPMSPTLIEPMSPTLQVDSSPAELQGSPMCSMRPSFPMYFCLSVYLLNGSTFFLSCLLDGCKKKTWEYEQMHVFTWLLHHRQTA